MCCPKATHLLTAPGVCCPRDKVDACGVCEGTGKTVDAKGRCCAGALDHYGFTTNRIGWQLFFATAKATALAMGAYSTASALEESLSGWFHGGRGRFELVGFAHGLCLPALCCLCAERPGNVLR